jgi:hypothetical protein
MLVDACDMCQFKGIKRFTLCVILMWTIHDLPTYSLFLRQVIKGYIKVAQHVGPTHLRDIQKF